MTFLRFSNGQIRVQAIAEQVAPTMNYPPTESIKSVFLLKESKKIKNEVINPLVLTKRDQYPL